MQVRKSVCGYCPETDDDMEIEVNFVSIPITGNVAGSQYIKSGFLCSHASSHHCSTAGITGKECPVYKMCDDF